MRAISSNTHSAWSAVSAFTTESPPESEPLPSLLTAPNLYSPEAGAKGVGLKPEFQWSAIAGAGSYELLVATDVSLANPLIIKIGTYALPNTAWQSDISLDYDTTYYWKVRAIGSNPQSAWSAVGAFTTRSTAESEPLLSSSTAPRLYSPQAGAIGMPLRPVFQWSAIADAESYELLVARDVSLANPIIIKVGVYALSSTAWQSDIGLDYDTTYYWKVRATGSNPQSVWSAVGAFTTESPPLEPSPPPSPPTPPQPTIPDWVKYLVGGLLLTVILLLITMLVLVIGIRRL